MNNENLDENILMKIKYEVYKLEDENEKTKKKTQNEMIKEIKGIIIDSVNRKKF